MKRLLLEPSNLHVYMDLPIGFKLADLRAVSPLGNPNPWVDHSPRRYRPVEESCIYLSFVLAPEYSATIKKERG